MLAFRSLNLLAIFAVLSGILFTGCAEDTSQSTTDHDDKTVITFWHYFSQEQEKPLKDLITKFEAANPDITVKSLYQGNPGDLKQKLDSSLAASPANNPAMATVYESWADDFYKNEYLKPVEDFASQPGEWTQEDRDDIVKAFIDGNTWDGKLVTVPFNKSIYLLYANMDLLKDAGYTTAPATQEEFADAIRKATKSEGGRNTYGLGVMPKGEAFTTLFYARGGEFMTADGKIQVDTPLALEVLQYLKGLQHPDRHFYVNPDYMSQPFAGGQIAMYVYSSASLPYNAKIGDKFVYATAPIPGAENGRYLMQGTNLAIFENHTSTTQAAAWKFTKFLLEPENNAEFVTRAGYVPVRYSMLQEPVMQEALAKDPHYAVAANLVLSDKGRQEPKFRGWEGLRNDMNTMIDKLLAVPGSDPAALLKELQQKADSYMNR